MKKCPKCGASIQENARFCLYCMTSFEEKTPIKTEKETKKRWPIIIAAVLVLALILSVFMLIPKKPSNTGNSSDSNNTAVEEQNGKDTDNSTLSPQENGQSQPIPDNQDNNQSQTNSSGNSESNDSNRNQNTTPPDNDTSNDDNTPTVTPPKFTYVEATIENTYPTGYSAMYTPENAIVITKVDYIEESGNYVIPDTIDGKKVAAIMPSAFCDSKISPTVKSVTLPSTVRTIWNNAFKECYNLTDIYIKSEVIGIYEDAFPTTAKRNGTLNIHCAKNCRNFEFYYYKNIANKYGAVYKEWNG